MLDLFVWYASIDPYERAHDISSLRPKELRNVEIMLQRYGAYGEHLVSMQAIAEAHGFTKQNVSRIINEVLERIEQDALPINLLDEVRATIEPHMPATVDELQAKVGQRLGPSLSIKNAERFAQEVLRTSIVDLGALRDPETGDADIAAAFRQVILSMVRSVGAAQVHFLAGLMSERLGRWVAAPEITTHAKSRFGFQWLSEQDGWFWYGQETDNVATRCALKILHVAERSVDVLDIAAGLDRWQRTAKWRNIAGMYSIALPVHVLAELVTQLPSVEPAQSARFRLANGAAQPESHLSETEATILGSMRKSNCVLTRGELITELVDTGLVNQVTLDTTLGGSPIFKSVDRAYFTVVGGRLGVRPEPTANIHPAQVVPPPDIDGEGWNKLFIEIPKTAFRHNKWIIPRRLSVLLSSGAYTINNFSDPAIFKGPELGKPAFHRLIGKLAPPGRTDPLRVEFRVHPEKRIISFKVIETDDDTWRSVYLRMANGRRRP